MEHDYISIGCDPELFAKRRGRFISVHELLPGTKTKPCSVPCGAVQVDGVAAEFNIKPAKTVDEFLNNIKQVTSVMEVILSKKAEGITLVAEPTATFSARYFNSLPFSVKQLGCEPDFSAYTVQANPKPETDQPFRTGSGHVHIQIVPDNKFINDTHSAEHMETCSSLVKELDVSLYHASQAWDDDKKRMELYGKPGAFRPKTYGLEYRVLSNAWLRREETKRYVFDATVATTKMWIDGGKVNELFETFVGKFGDAFAPKIDEICSFLSFFKLPTPLDYAKTA